jgi:uncharacterized Fe-S cluster protein YjdI
MNPVRCIHVARCVAGSPEVFRPNERPWIQPSNADADSIASGNKPFCDGTHHTMGFEG